MKKTNFFSSQRPSQAPKARRAIIVFILCGILFPSPGYAAEKLIGTACSGDQNIVDWDTIGQCVSSTFARIATFFANGLGVNMGTTAPVSTVDISGNVTIGSTYAGTNAAPTNGLLVQGIVGVGTTSANSGAALDLSSNTNSILMPTGTTGQEPGSPVKGMFRYNSTTNLAEYWNGLTWTSLNSSGGGSGAGYFIYSKGGYTSCMNTSVGFGSSNGVSTTVTITTSAAHGLTNGTSVTTSGFAPAALNGTFSITVTGATTFTYTLASPPGSVTANGSYCAGAGGLAVANAQCLNDLTVLGTSWFGYAQANAAGWLNSTHVKAFLCDGSTCNNLDANTKYYFANNSDTSSGGAYFTTDGSGLGPNDSLLWERADHFGGAAINYATGRGASSSTAWLSTSSSNTCTGWTSVSSASNADYGATFAGTAVRWLDTLQTLPCSHAFALICLVNP